MGSKRNIPFVSNRQRDFVIGETYHIFQRGNHGVKVFHSDVERGLYVERFFMLCRRHMVLVHNFVLMGTHIHFVLEPQRDEAISELMRDLQGPHAREHNKLINKKGNLWTQHYGCKHVDSPEYYRKLMWYVEHNPVRTGRCKRAEKYKWSGAQSHLAGEQLTIDVEGRKVKLDLYLDRWRKDCQEQCKMGWREYLGSDALPDAMKKMIETILDGKARRQFLNEEKQRRLEAERAERREYKELVKKFGPGVARQMQAEKAKERAKQAMKDQGDEPPRSLGAG